MVSCQRDGDSRRACVQLGVEARQRGRGAEIGEVGAGRARTAWRWTGRCGAPVARDQQQGSESSFRAAVIRVLLSGRERTTGVRVAFLSFHRETRVCPWFAAASTAAQSPGSTSPRATAAAVKPPPHNSLTCRATGPPGRPVGQSLRSRGPVPRACCGRARRRRARAWHGRPHPGGRRPSRCSSWSAAGMPASPR